jgi:hypothetical protein
MKKKETFEATIAKADEKPNTVLFCLIIIHEK